MDCQQQVYCQLFYPTYKRPGERWYQCGTVLVYLSCRNTTSSWNVAPSLGLGTPGVKDSLGLLASTFKLGRLLVTDLVGNGDQYNTSCWAIYFVSAHINNTCHINVFKRVTPRHVLPSVPCYECFQGHITRQVACYIPLLPLTSLKRSA
jgi:hypothetical protein